MVSEMENARDWVFNFAMETQYAHILSQKIDTVLEKLKYATKLNVAFGFALRNVKDGSYRYCYAQRNNTLMKFLKPVVAKEDLVEIKDVVSNADVIQACTKESAKTKMEILLLCSEKFPWRGSTAKATNE